jgi:ABC-type thiamine transport system ATPase subunit
MMFVNILSNSYCRLQAVMPEMTEMVQQLQKENRLEFAALNHKLDTNSSKVEKVVDDLTNGKVSLQIGNVLVL